MKNIIRYGMIVFVVLFLMIWCVSVLVRDEIVMMNVRLKSSLSGFEVWCGLVEFWVCMCMCSCFDLVMW